MNWMTEAVAWSAVRGSGMLADTETIHRFSLRSVRNEEML